MCINKFEIRSIGLDEVGNKECQIRFWHIGESRDKQIIECTYIDLVNLKSKIESFLK